MVEILDAVPQSRSGGWTKERVVFLSISAVVTATLLVSVREVLLPFFLAIIIAYVLTPLVAWCESRLRLPRSVSIVGVYSLVLGVIVLSIVAMAPRIYEESSRFVREVPQMVRATAHEHGKQVEQWVRAYQGGQKEAARAEEPKPTLVVTKQGEGFAVELTAGVTVAPDGKNGWKVTRVPPPRSKEFRATELIDEGAEQMITFVQLNALEFIKLGQTIITTLSRGIFLLFMTLMVAGYLMYTRERVLEFFRSLGPKMYRPGFDLLLVRIDRGLAGVVRGQLLICLVNGVLSAIGFALFGLKYWPVLALVAAVMSLIPIFGSILSTIPAVVIGMTQGGWTAMWVLLWILGIHQVEANFLNPKIIGDAARLHPVLVVFALLVGEHYFGLWGALLGVPVLSVSQSLFNHFRYGLPDVEADSLLAAAGRSRRA